MRWTFDASWGDARRANLRSRSRMSHSVSLRRPNPRAGNCRATQGRLQLAGSNSSLRRSDHAYDTRTFAGQEARCRGSGTRSGVPVEEVGRQHDSRQEVCRPSWEFAPQGGSGSQERLTVVPSGCEAARTGSLAVSGVRPTLQGMPLKPLSCPHCASSDLEVVPVQFEGGPALAVCCKECGAFGPPSHSDDLSDDPEHAIAAWNQRQAV